MASATFGRKGVTSPISQPGLRRAAFGKAGAAPVVASVEPAEEAADPVAQRRAAFLAAERARAADADGGEAEGAPLGRTRTAMLVKERSLATAYILWLFLGGFSAHRFYLGAPLTAIAQVCLWYVSLMFFMAGSSGALYPLTLGWLWIIGDGLFMSRLRNAANERARRRAEAIVLEKVEPAEPVSS